MEKYLPVIKQALELLVTVESGLRYMEARLKEDEPGKAADMADDVERAVSSLAAAMDKVWEELKRDDVMKPSADKINEELSRLMAACAGEQTLDALDIMQMALLPAYSQWQQSIKDIFGPYLLS